VNVPHAVLWNRAGTRQDLGALAGGTWSDAFAINIFGTVVGNSSWAGAGAHAFVWSAKRGMRDLNALLPAHAGWELQAAVAINVGGEIVGSGTVNGQQHAYLLTPSCLGGNGC